MSDQLPIPPVPGVANRLLIQAAIGDITLGEFASKLEASHHWWAPMVRGVDEQNEHLHTAGTMTWKILQDTDQAKVQAEHEAILESAYHWLRRVGKDSVGKFGIGVLSQDNVPDGKAIRQKITRLDLLNSLCQAATAVDSRLVAMPDHTGRLFLHYLDEESNLKPAGKYRAALREMVQPRQPKILA